MMTPLRVSADFAPAIDPQIEALQDKLRDKDAELAAHKLAAAAGLSSPMPVEFATALENQTKLLEAVLNKPKPLNSTIRVEPKVTWPRLGDDGPGGKEVEDFYEKFEDLCSLANNGNGMQDQEMMVALKHCLHGSRKQIYENVLKANKKVDGVDENEYWGRVYRQIRQRLFKFLETPLERQLRIDGEWSQFHKTKGMTALQFEAEWERLHAELVEVLSLIHI